MRLNKFLARAGVASRRASDDLIRTGRVTVNGHIVDGLGVRIDPNADRVTVDGQSVEQQHMRVYCLLNKPRGCLTTVADPFGRRTVMAYVKDLEHRVFPVGRLDYDTEGLLLLTNDGELSHAVTHPRYALDKEYETLVHGHPGSGTIRRLEQGVPMDGRLTAPARVCVQTRTADGTLLSITVHEGRKRQIRNMCAYVGYPVKRLRRIRLGPLLLNGLPSGRWRFLSDQEIQALQQAVGWDVSV